MSFDGHLHLARQATEVREEAMRSTISDALVNLIGRFEMLPFAEEVPDFFDTQRSITDLGIPSDMIGLLISRKKLQMWGEADEIGADVAERDLNAINQRLESAAGNADLTPQLRRVLGLRGG